MSEEIAWKLVMGIHSQNGDRDFDEFKDKLIGSFASFASFDLWCNYHQSRTDLSDDYKWELQCFEESFRVVYSLVHSNKPIVNIKTASIEDLKQNEHVRGLLEIIDIYGNELDWDGVNNPAYIQDRGKIARTKLKEWE